MDELVAAVQAAIAPGASPERRQAGAAACRTILAELEGGPPPQPAAAPPIDAAQIASVVGALRGMPPDQLLDLAISKLRAALPSGAAVAPVRPLHFQLIPIPRQGG